MAISRFPQTIQIQVRQLVANCLTLNQHCLSLDYQNGLQLLLYQQMKSSAFERGVHESVKLNTRHGHCIQSFGTPRQTTSKMNRSMSAEYLFNLQRLD